MILSRYALSSLLRSLFFLILSFIDFNLCFQALEVCDNIALILFALTADIVHSTKAHASHPAINQATAQNGQAIAVQAVAHETAPVTPHTYLPLIF
jgi:hypothetical protein